MKTLLVLALLSAPVFACPHQEAAQKTAQKSPDNDKKPAPPKKDDKPAEQAKAKQPEPAKKPS